MEFKRNKQIAISVLKCMTYDNVGILHDISRERVYQITKAILERVDPENVNRYNIKIFRIDKDRLIDLISELKTLVQPLFLWESGQLTGFWGLFGIWVPILFFQLRHFLFIL